MSNALEKALEAAFAEAAMRYSYEQDLVVSKIDVDTIFTS